MFNKDQWEQISEIYTKWWNKTLDRPIIKGVMKKDINADIPVPSQANCHDFSISPEEIINRIDADLKNKEFLGDAFPMANFDWFGPGIVAAFCGAKLNNTSGLVWFEPPCDIPISDLHIEFDPKNKWFNRIKDIYGAGIKKWNGQVLMCMPDIGGVIDILASFRGTDNLLIELYDEPDEVKRLVKEIHDVWIHVYNEYNDILQPVNPGYSDWNGINSKDPSCVLQSDFSFMISPQMFKEFIIDELRMETEKIQNTIYHMDGIGEIPHLDQILSLEKLDAVQWQQGEGAPPAREWLDIFRRIRESGKNMQVIGYYEDLFAVAEAVGPKGLYFNTEVYNKDDFLHAYNHFVR